MIRMSLIVKLLIPLLFLLTPTAAIAEQFTTYSCDDCDYAKARLIAMKETSEPECHFSIKPNTSPIVANAKCSGPPEIVMVANPITKQAFKFRVQLSCTGSVCDHNAQITDLTLTAEELELMQGFYTLHQTIRDAVYQAQATTQLTNQTFVKLDAQSTSTECSKSLIGYLTDPSAETVLNKEMADRITAHVTDHSWRDSISSAALKQISNELTLSVTPGITTIVDRTYEQNPLYHMISVGDPWQNRLSFEVDYGGNVDVRGIKSIELKFYLDRAGSVIGGYALSTLTGHGGVYNYTDPNDMPSPCIMEFISKGSHITVVENGSSGGGSSPGSGNGGKGGIKGSCPKTTQATICSTKKEGSSCTVTTFHFLAPCSE